MMSIPLNNEDRMNQNRNLKETYESGGSNRTFIELSLDSSIEESKLHPSNRFILKLQKAWNWTKKSATSIGVALLIFVILLAAGTVISYFVATTQEQDARDEALDLAITTGEWFSDQLDLAIMPLFSLAQFAVEIPMFRGLPQKIGTAGDVQHGALPFNPPSEVGDPHTHRNVTGVCDDPDLVDRFNEIAATIKKNAKMDGVLVNLQLAPEGVVCLLYPLVNTEDFDNNIALNNAGARGLDLMVDPVNSFIAKASIPQDSISIAGPLMLRQCRDISCDPAVQQAFIARLPIEVSDNVIEVDGKSYKKWGFATALINWNALITRSDIYSIFAARAMEFQLTRSDRKYNEITGLYEVSVVVLAETQTFSNHSKKRNKVSTALQTTNNEWEITVIFDLEQIKRTKILLFSMSAVISLCISILAFVILEQRQSKALMQAKVSAQAASVKTERDMTAYFAHELRNPLCAIDSALNAMPDDLPDSTRELISGMKECSDFMSSVMNTLLDLRKMEEGNMSLAIGPTSLSDLISSTHKMLDISAEKGVEFKTDILTEDKDWVYVDAHRLRQVLTNVVMNSLKHTKLGSVVLTVGWVDDFVKIECIDTGPGIPKDQQQRLFGRFLQEGGAPGSGLGLSIAKNIVTLMGGSIQYTSDPEAQQGTTCIILLPLTPCDPPDQTSLPLTKEETIKKCLRILIVDDLPMNQMMLKRRILNSISPNAEITLASTGEEAIEICNSFQFDVIFMDQYMEVAGGVLLGTDVIRILRSIGVKALIIGSSANEMEMEFQSAGANWTWQKPFPSNDIIIQQLRSALHANGTT